MKFVGILRNLTLICGVLSAQLTHAQTTATPQNITVFAAASLRGALDEIAALNTGTVTISYAGSGGIARQISLGAPADALILAHPRWMGWLSDQGIVQDSTTIAHNSLVLIGTQDAAPLKDPTEIKTRLGQNRLAMGQRISVPAGIYTQSWLSHIGQWDALSTQLAEVENVRLALALVARNDTPLGVVYRSDALAEPKVSILYDVPADTHEPITYPAAALTQSGAAFVKSLTTPQAQAILKTHGFTTPQVVN